MSDTELESLVAAQPVGDPRGSPRINTDAQPFALQGAIVIPIPVGLLTSWRMVRRQTPRPGCDDCSAGWSTHRAVPG
ncbi:hypothetical protein [Nocardia sp. NPDC049707]|uniref:hypothetical protein n=1 Tax=Nocardia sp. NPDC049707 TaxID=3154735 RepID=UPI00341CD044